jgi:phage-related protein
MIEPISYVVEHMEESVLSIMNDGIIGIRSILSLATGELDDHVSNIITSLLNSATNELNTINMTIQGFITQLDNSTAEILNEVFNVLASIENLISSAVNRIGQFAINILNLISSGIARASSAIESLSQTTEASIQTLISEGFGELTNELVSISNRIQTIADTTIAEIGNGINTIVTTSAKDIDAIAATSVNVAKNSFNAVNNGLSTATRYANNAKTAIVATGGDISSQLQNVDTRIENVVSEGTSRMKSYTGDAISMISYIIAIALIIAGAYAVVYLFNHLSPNTSKPSADNTSTTRKSSSQQQAQP